MIARVEVKQHRSIIALPSNAGKRGITMKTLKFSPLLKRKSQHSQALRLAITTIKIS